MTPAELKADCGEVPQKTKVRKGKVMKKQPPEWNLTAIELELAILRGLPATDLVEHWERLQKIQTDLASLFYTVTYQRAVNLAAESNILEEKNHE